MGVTRKIDKKTRQIADHIAAKKFRDMRNSRDDPTAQRQRLSCNAIAELSVCQYLGVQYRSARIEGIELGTR